MTKLDQQKKENFWKENFWYCALEDAIFWIGENLKPEDVFSFDKLKLWAKNHGYKEKP